MTNSDLNKTLDSQIREQLRVDIGRIIDVYSYDIQKLEGGDRLVRANEAIDEILALIQTVGEGLIGEYEKLDQYPSNSNVNTRKRGRNDLRKQQRKTLKDITGVDRDE